MDKTATPTDTSTIPAKCGLSISSIDADLEEPVIGDLACSSCPTMARPYARPLAFEAQNPGQDVVKPQPDRSTPDRAPKRQGKLRFLCFLQRVPSLPFFGPSLKPFREVLKEPTQFERGPCKMPEAQNRRPETSRGRLFLRTQQLRRGAGEQAFPAMNYPQQGREL